MDTDDLDPEDIALGRWMANAIREEGVRDLLRGNDCCCFTTQQYAEQYECSGWSPNTPPHPMPLDLAEIHLRSLPHLVQEVKPGVWARKEVPQ